MRESVIQALTEPFVGEQSGFRNAVAETQRILYLADNAGEIAFERQDHSVEVRTPGSRTALL